MQKKLPIGIENFENMIKENYYYVDKTGLIKQLLNEHGLVNLFTRPRRFGKSLNMSMLKYFFEIFEQTNGMTVTASEIQISTAHGMWSITAEH